MSWSKFKTVSVTVFFTICTTIIYANMRSPQAELDYRIDTMASVADPRFVKAIGDLLDPAFVEGNRVEALNNGDEIFPAMLEAIRSAQKTISFESYIYWSGHIGAKFADALSERARAGVAVHVLVDWAGSGKIDKAFLKELQEAGVEVQRFHAPRWYNITRMNNRTHRKILVVDGRIGFTGGVGIADEWTGQGQDPKHWRDAHYRVEGPVVNQMQSAFMDNWLKARPEVHSNEAYFPELPKAGKSLAQMFISSNEEGGSSVRIMYLMALTAARKTIHLESAYFVPDEHTVQMLVEARQRGVEIEIIVPGPYSDSAVVDHASREQWGPLLRAGVKIYEFQPALFHCKILVVDGLFVSVGSTNFDERSFCLNDEANLNVVDAEFASSQILVFERDRAQSKLVHLEDWEHRPLSEKFLGKLTGLIDSQL